MLSLFRSISITPWGRVSRFFSRNPLALYSTWDDSYKNYCCTISFIKTFLHHWHLQTSIANEWRRRKGWSQLEKKRLPYNACILSGGWARTLLALASRQVPVWFSVPLYICELNVSSWPCSEVFCFGLFGFPLFTKINLRFLIPIQSRVWGTVYLWVKRLLLCAILVK